MLYGIVFSVVVAYGAAWLFLKAFYAWDARQARKIAERIRVKQLIRHGREKSHEEVMDDVRSDILHGWD